MVFSGMRPVACVSEASKTIGLMALPRHQRSARRKRLRGGASIHHIQESRKSILYCVHGKHDKYEWIGRSPLLAFSSPQEWRDWPQRCGVSVVSADLLHGF